MQVVAYKIIPDPAKNAITFSKNYRIFSTGEPLREAVQITGFKEDLEFGSADSANIIRKLRYSTDRANWSLWYSFTPDNLTELLDLFFDEADVFFEVKYEYDDLTYSELAQPLKIESIKIFVKSKAEDGGMLTPPVQCSEEKCPSLIAEQEASFKPYDAGTAIGIAHELSLQTNKIFGHDVIYFKTEPDRDGGDFIFKEWTLFKTITRRCIKVMVPENKFPDNKPNFTEFGVDFEIPFEIHIDHIYFQMMFGRNTQPRKRDYLFFPLVNRMYEIQGSYLYRGFMMEPMYWKIQLIKFQPNIDMYMKAENRTFLDNLIVSSDQLYGNEAASQALDSLDKQQFKTISNKFDESRRALHPDLKNKILDFTFNYSPLIEYYYDFSSVTPSIVRYEMQTYTDPTEIQKSQNLTPSQPYEVYAYQDSQIYEAWMNNKLVTGDSNVNGSGEIVKVKMNGPKESYSAFGKYVVVEGYRNLGLKSTERKNIQSDSGIVQFKQMENAVIYKLVASTVETPNMTFCEMINFNRGTQDVILFKGFDDYQQKGLIISGHIQDNSGVPNLTIYVQVNESQYTFVVGNIEYAKWYALLVPVSAQYGQLEVNLYSLRQDPANIKNFDKTVQKYTNYMKIGQFEFETTSNFCLPSGNFSVANVRLFNTMVQPEDHEFVISQLFIRDESTLAIIDNARPRLNAPFVAINR